MATSVKQLGAQVDRAIDRMSGLNSLGVSIDSYIDNTMKYVSPRDYLGQIGFEYIRTDKKYRDELNELSMEMAKVIAHAKRIKQGIDKDYTNARKKFRELDAKYEMATGSRYKW